MIEIAEWLPDVLNGKLVVHQSLTHIDTHRSFDRFTVAIVCQSSNHGIAVSLRHKPAFFVNLYNIGLAAFPCDVRQRSVCRRYIHLRSIGFA